MMVTFVSECEKKALKNTRRVLDSFANRIGQRTWQTIITQEGLHAVKKLLKKTASKNSAIACHWQRSRNRNELVWIVGNRRKFNAEGAVPVNYTEKEHLNLQVENNWCYLPLIKALVAMAALFHDWGKSSDFFQAKLVRNKVIKDPLRHEWLSVLFLHTFSGGKKDSEWLEQLATQGASTQTVVTQMNELRKKKESNTPLAKLPYCAATIAWLILSHHKLPYEENDEVVRLHRENQALTPEYIFAKIKKNWGYCNQKIDSEALDQCYRFSKGLPCDSPKWIAQAQKSAKKLLDCLDLLERSIQDKSWRLVLLHSRMTLMLADHYESSLPEDPGFQDGIDLYANSKCVIGKSEQLTKELKQKLTEHLLRVAKRAISNGHFLPVFEGRSHDFLKAYDIKSLQKKSPVEYAWQDKPIVKIEKWRKDNSHSIDNDHFGFFTVNMASTGKGKTFANAKIMRALSAEGQGLRYVLALGLRTLTLQTGEEYRKRIGLDESEMGVFIGSKAVQELYEQNEAEYEDEIDFNTGSESEQSLLDEEISWNATIADDYLATALPRNRDRQFLYAPVLSCTIDHIIPATETKKGGRYILPLLRLMSSDLVIDEIDDFDGVDLVAIGRLLHLAGMLGRKVMISSATISPDVAEGYFVAYQAGWNIFSSFRSVSKTIGCCWVDEFGAQIYTQESSDSIESSVLFQKKHNNFIKYRIKKLTKETVKRKAEIWSLPLLEEVADELKVKRQFQNTILRAALVKHQQHCHRDEYSRKKVSFGVVRVANILPCIEVTRYLLNADLPENTDIRVMAYHSQQLLIMRDAQEKHLDAVLKRKKGVQSSFDHPHIRTHLASTQAENVLFILVATPVEEVGRDHDFDWAVIEPSSYRSIIQLAGRVLRHLSVDDIEEPNISILQHNLKGLLRADLCFLRPGYETRMLRLKSHDLNDLLAGEPFAERLDATPRIIKKKKSSPLHNLADLEHESIHLLLTNYTQKGAGFLQGWLQGYWWLTGVSQRLIRFRNSTPHVLIYCCPEKDGWNFFEKDRMGEFFPVAKRYDIQWADPLTVSEESRLWLYRNYEKLLEHTSVSDILKAAKRYGEVSLPLYDKSSNTMCYLYFQQLGFVQKCKFSVQE